MQDHLEIKFDGEEKSDIYQALLGLEIDLNDGVASVFRIQLKMVQREGAWPFLDESYLRPWKEVSITAGLKEDHDLLLNGYITHTRPNFMVNADEATLEIVGMDKSIAMDRVEVLKSWPDKSDSDIAEEIFSKYGLDAEIEISEVVHEEATSTIIQRDTDMQFLRRLALRNGYQCFVQGDSGFFKTIDLESHSQGVLAVNFGEETNTYGFNLEMDGLAPSRVGMFQIDRLNKEVREVLVEQSNIKILGEIPSIEVVSDKTIASEGISLGEGLRYVGQNNAFAEAEMNSLCQGLFQKAEWSVRAFGEVNSMEYGKLIKPRQLITVKGIGETYSGEFYVSNVKHQFTNNGYTQYVSLMSNAILQGGDEAYSESAGLSLPF